MLETKFTCRSGGVIRSAPGRLEFVRLKPDLLLMPEVALAGGCDSNFGRDAEINRRGRAAVGCGLLGPTGTRRRNNDDLGCHDDRGGQDEGGERRGVDADAEQRAEDRHEDHQVADCFGGFQAVAPESSSSPVTAVNNTNRLNVLNGLIGTTRRVLDGCATFGR